MSDRFFLYIFIQYNVHIACLQDVVVLVCCKWWGKYESKNLRKKDDYYYYSNFVQTKTRAVKWTSRTHNIVYIGVRNIQVGLTMVQFTEYILYIVKCAGKFRTFSMVDWTGDGIISLSSLLLLHWNTRVLYYCKV